MLWECACGAVAQTPGDDSKGLDELTSLSLELGLYDERPKAIEVSESVPLFPLPQNRRFPVTDRGCLMRLFPAPNYGRRRHLTSLFVYKGEVS